MPTTKVIKPVETATRLSGKPIIKQVKMKTGIRAQSVGKVQATPPCKTRASSCPRSVHISRCEGRKTSMARREEGRSRSTCVTAPKPAGSRVKTTTNAQKVTSSCSVKHAGIITAKSGDKTSKAVELSTEDQRTQLRHKDIQCLKAFTVIAPNPMRRREIQKKAEEELAALEELRLSRAMAYVSIHPSSVGGCMSLQEVRLKQQQEMQASRRQKQIKKLLVEPTSVVMS